MRARRLRHGGGGSRARPVTPTSGPFAIPIRGFYLTRPVLALERVEVAHMKSYQQPTPSFSFPTSHTAAAAAASSSLTPPLGRRTASSPSPFYKGGVRKAGAAEQDGASAADSHATMDYTMVADDAGGPPATRNSGAILPRTLGGSLATAEHFYFRDTENGITESLSHGGRSHSAGGGEDDTDDNGGSNKLSPSSFPSPQGRYSQQQQHHHHHYHHHHQCSPQRFYFCALCREEIDPAVMTPRGHISTDNRASHTNHTCREVVLDSLALLGVRGYPVDHMYHVWSTTLYHHPAFPRIRAWVRPWWSQEKRANHLFELLRGLKDAGVIDVGLAGVAPDVKGGEAYHHRRRVAFERLEYIGDNAWGTRMSSRMMLLFPDQQWQYSERAYAFNCFRDAIEMNVTNEILFDALRLERLFPAAQQAKLGSGKMKADAVEAIIGELHLALWGCEPKLYDDVGYTEVNAYQEDRLVSVLEHCLTELYDLIMLNYCQELSWNAVPLAKELAVKHIWQSTRPSVKQQKGFPRRHLTTTTTTAPIASATLPETAFATTTATTTSAAAASVKPPVPPTDTEQEGQNDDLSLMGGGAPSPSTRRTATSLLGSVRLLPALPGLFTAPTPYPRVVPNPLRAQTTHEISDMTKSSFTGQDVFTELIESYRRLRFLSDDALQVFDVQDSEVNPPRWGELVGKLVPSLVWGQGVSVALHQHQLDRGNAFFADPYYNLFPAPRAADKGEGRGKQESSARQRMWGALALPTVTRANPIPTHNERMDLARRSAVPTLQEARADLDAGGEDALLGGAEEELPFAPSRFVPPVGVKPPSAGVVTERNLYPGQFAFLAYRSTSSPAYPSPIVSNAEEAVAEFLQERARRQCEGEGGAGGGEAVTQIAKDADADADEAALLQLNEAVRYWVAKAERRRHSPEAAVLFQRQVGSPSS